MCDFIVRKFHRMKKTQSFFMPEVFAGKKFPRIKGKRMIIFNFTKLNLIVEEIEQHFREFFVRVYADCKIPIHFINNLYMTFTFIWFQMDELCYSWTTSYFCFFWNKIYQKGKRVKGKKYITFLYKKQLYIKNMRLKSDKNLKNKKKKEKELWTGSTLQVNSQNNFHKKHISKTGKNITKTYFSSNNYTRRVSKILVYLMGSN